MRWVLLTPDEDRGTGAMLGEAYARRGVPFFSFDWHYRVE